MNRQQLVITGVILALIAIGLAWVPLPYRHVLSLGTDSYETHHPVAGNRTVAQQVTTQHKVVGVGVLAVNLRRAEHLAPLQVAVNNADGTEVARAIITPDMTADDELSWVKFSAGIVSANSTATVTFSAPEATKNNAYGIRFNGDNKHLAIGVIEVLPAWQHLIYWQQTYPNLARLVIAMLIFGAIGAGLASSNIVTRALEQRRIFLLALCGLALLTIVIRIPAASAVDSIFGGDAFNYLLKSRALVEGRDPFAADPRKAPLLSLLALPGLTIIDPLLMGRIINIVSAAAGVVLIVLLGKRLGLSPLFALFAGALLSVNRMWWWESVHGLANIPYATLLLAATLAYLVGKPYALGVISGLATLMRFEGALAVATLLPALWVRVQSWRSVWRSLLPVIILLLIPLLLWPFSGVSGIRTPTDIIDDPGLYIAWDWHDYVNNIQNFRLFVGRLWLLIPFVGNQLLAFGIGASIGLVLTKKYRWPRAVHQILGAAPYLAGILVVGVIAYGNQELYKMLVLGIATLTGAGIVSLAVKSPRVIGIYVMLAVQVALVTLILPKERYYVTVIPWAALGIIGGLAIVTEKRRWHRIGGGLLGGLVIGLVAALTTQALPGLISDYNDKSHEATALTSAATYVRKYPSQVAAPDYAALFMTAYLPTDRYILLPPETADAAAELKLLRTASITYVLYFTDRENLTSLAAYPDQFSIEAQLDGATVYRLRSTK